MESWATLVGLYAIHELTINSGQHGVNPAAKQNLEEQLANTRAAYRTALQTYEMLPDHSHLYPDVVDDVFLALADSFGYAIFPRRFKMLQPPNAPWCRLNNINPATAYSGSKITAMTITACAFSVAAQVDLKNLFQTRWDFPIDDVLYDQIKPEIDQMINSSTALGEPRGEHLPWFHVLGNYPNPFNPTTMINFVLPEKALAKVTVYDLLGRGDRCIVADRTCPGSVQSELERFLHAFWCLYV